MLAMSRGRAVFLSAMACSQEAPSMPPLLCFIWSTVHTVLCGESGVNEGSSVDPVFDGDQLMNGRWLKRRNTLEFCGGLWARHYRRLKA